MNNNKIKSFITICLILCLSSTFLQAESPLTYGHQILLERGLQLKSLTFPSQASPSWSVDLWRECGFNTVDIWQAAYDHGIQYGFPSGDDGLPFSVWVTNPLPSGYQTFSIASAGYMSNLVSIQLGDEDGIISGHGGGDEIIANQLKRSMTEGIAPTCSGEEGLSCAVVSLALEQARIENNIINLQPVWDKLSLETK